jgi:hypothetical protein
MKTPMTKKLITIAELVFPAWLLRRAKIKARKMGKITFTSSEG